ncbi:DNA recombination protein RmuC [Alcaligenes faecalis]|uniref:DNA recombination protein RmuC n=1 Tax=Alcaligenes faecalis TaxID=511 RepID=A0AAE9KNF0_ALCFA|nr:DNA recombination protein RmuC [Alcaligenes faecalis]UPL21259.1 DNA recombination protein RmuC [Alcaligenes faecalis]
MELDLRGLDVLIALVALALGLLIGLWLRARMSAPIEQALEDRCTRLEQDLAHAQEQTQDAQDRAVELDKELIRRDAQLQAQEMRNQAIQEDLEHSREQMRLQFESLAQQILEAKGQTLRQDSQRTLDEMLRPFREQLAGFQLRVNQVHDESVKGQTALSLELQRMQEMGLRMSAEAHSLAVALKGDKKTTGNWGETQLEKTLEVAGLVRGVHFDTQWQARDEQGRLRYPDFVVHLPQDKHLVLDCKVSLVDYDRAIRAETDEERQQSLQAHVQALRNHIDDLASKDYSALAGLNSPGFVFMYVPIEAAYMQALQHHHGLFDYGLGKNVLMVSHTTLLPILRTVANIWMMVRSNEQAHELSQRAGDIYNQVSILAERLKKLGETLGQAGKHYNSTVTALAGQQGLYGKVSRFAELSARAKRTRPGIEPLHTDIEHERLDWVLSEDEVPGQNKEADA